MGFLDDQEIDQFDTSTLPKYERPSPGLIGSIERGIDTSQATFYGMGALASDIVGADGAENWFMKNYERNLNEAEENAPTVQLDEATDSFGNAWTYGVETIGSLIPSMVTAAVGAATGGGAIALIGKTAAGSYAKKKLASTILKRQIGKIVKKTALKHGIHGAEKKALTEEVTRQAFVRLGSKAGVFGTVTAMESGGNYGELAQRGVKAPLSSLGFGAASGALEFLGGNIKLIDKLMPGAGKYFQKAVSSGKGGVVRRAASRLGKELAKNMPAEFAQEAGQELMSALNVAANTEDKFFTKDTAYRAFESGIAGALGGGLGAIPSAITSKTQAEIDAGAGAPPPNTIGPQKEVSPVDDKKVSAKVDELANAFDSGVVYGPERPPVADVGSFEPQSSDPNAPWYVDPTPIAEQPRPEPKGPDSINELVGKNVNYGGIEGILVKQPDGYYVVNQDEDIFVESGENPELTPDEIGVKAASAVRVDYGSNAQQSPGNIQQAQGVQPEAQVTPETAINAAPGQQDALMAEEKRKAAQDEKEFADLLAVEETQKAINEDTKAKKEFADKTQAEIERKTYENIADGDWVKNASHDDLLEIASIVDVGTKNKSDARLKADILNKAKKWLELQDAFDSGKATATATTGGAKPDLPSGPSSAASGSPSFTMPSEKELAGKTVKVKAVHEKTGQVYEVEEDASTALKEADDRINAIYEILECL